MKYNLLQKEAKSILATISFLNVHVPFRKAAKLKENSQKWQMHQYTE